MTWCFLPTLRQRSGQRSPSLAKVSEFHIPDYSYGTHSANLAGDAFVRELDVSRITLRLKEKQDKKGDQDTEGVTAKLQGSTIDVLQRCLVGFLLLRSEEPSNVS